MIGSKKGQGNSWVWGEHPLVENKRGLEQNNVPVHQQRRYLRMCAVAELLDDLRMNGVEDLIVRGEDGQRKGGGVEDQIRRLGSPAALVREEHLLRANHVLPLS